MMIRIFLGGALLLVLGCAEEIIDLPGPFEASADAGFSIPDTGTLDGSPSVPSELVFVAEEGRGPAVRLVNEGLSESAVSLGVEVLGVSDVYGIGFRLSYDPELLSFESMETGRAWPSSARLLLQTHVARPGLLVGVVSETGSARGFVGAEVLPLAVIRFRMNHDDLHGLSPIRLLSQGTFVVKSDGSEEASLAILGGHLEKR